MLPSKNLWDLDQRIKSMICEVNMTLIDAHHRTWFVISLTPHLRTTLTSKTFQIGRSIGNGNEIT